MPKVTAKFPVMLRHELEEYKFCVNESHIHYGNLVVVSEDLDNVNKIKEIGRNLISVDCIIEMGDNTIQSTLEKFYEFCQDFILTDLVILEIEHDYTISFEYKK